jgi:transcriptional regulator with PAS, ATPase and Fis domain
MATSVNMTLGFRTPMSTDEMIGDSPLTRALDEDIRLAARSDAKVLITGESGVGKEVAAQLIHSRSPRSRYPLVTINCAGVPDTLLESEFFGHVRGSFTGAYRDRPGFLEKADRGTVFLDEIGEMSLRLQGLLLRFLETGEVQRVGSALSERRIDVRVIAASNRSLEAEVEKRNFREDLFYRINVIRLNVPALRARLTDVPLLTRHFVDQFSRQYSLGQVEIAPGVLDVLSAYVWPGNVRELRNIVERAMVRLKGRTLTLADLPTEIRRGPAAIPASESEVTAARPVASWEPLFDRMVRGRESFWTVVYEPFMSRDVTRQQIRDIVAQGLERTSGDYRELAELFNIVDIDYKRFVALLRRYECHVPLPPLRKRMMKVEPLRAALVPVFDDPARFGTDS